MWSEDLLSITSNEVCEEIRHCNLSIGSVGRGLGSKWDITTNLGYGGARKTLALESNL